MDEFIATAELFFGPANSIAGMLVNPSGSNKSISVKALVAAPTQGRVPNVVLQRLAGATHTPIPDTTPPTAMRVSSLSAAAGAVPTTSGDHTYSGGTVNLEIALALHAQLGAEIALDHGEALAVVMVEDGTGASALFAVRWSE